MNILYILSGTTMQGGATKSFLSMMSAVIEAGNDVAVVCPDESGVAQHLIHSGINTKVIPYRHAAWPLLVTTKDKVMFLPRLIRDFFLNRKARREIMKFASDFKADIIHDNTSVTDGGDYAAEKLGIPHVTHIREYGDKDFHLHIFNLKKRLNAPYNYNVAITRDIAKYRGLQDDPKSKVIYNGVIDFECESISRDKKPYFLYAGRIQEGKGISDLIDAYIEYCRQTSDPIPLKVAGETTSYPLLDSVNSRIEAAGIKDKVDFLGGLDNVKPLMRDTLAVIIPSLFEGFGRVMPEAMACGALCVARDTGGSHEQLENGRKLKNREIGLRFKDTTELASLLKKIHDEYKKGDAFGEDTLFGTMITDAASAVNTLYTKESNGKQIIELYERIINKR